MRILGALFFAVAAVFAQNTEEWGNPAFAGESLAPWFLRKLNPQYEAQTLDTCPGREGRCYKMSWPDASKRPGRNEFANIMQIVDAKRYRGKRIRLRMHIKVTGGGRAQMWIRADRPQGMIGFFDNMDSRPVRENAGGWKAYETEGDIEPDAASIVAGVMFFAPGEVLVADTSLEILGDAKIDVEPARILTDRGRTNLVALAKLYGYVRYFYPAALTVNWEQFLMEAIPAAEKASNDSELVEVLRDKFSKLAPQVEVFLGDAPKVRDVTAEKMIVWRHRGLGMNAQNVYKSELVIVPAPGGKLKPPYASTIAPGIFARVPLALPAPEVAPDNRFAQQPKYTYKPAFHRTSRLAAVFIAWNIFQHFYPYFDVVKTDWPVELNKALAAAAADATEKDFALTMKRLVAALKDGHGAVYYSLNPSAPLTMDRVEGKIVITHVRDAQGEPVSAGDEVLKIQGGPAETVYAEAAALISGATPQWIRHGAMAELARCSGPSLDLYIARRSDPTHPRQVSLRCGYERVKEPRPGRIKELEPGIWYVNLDGINDMEWNDVRPKLESAKGIVFDMRGYPGMGPRFLQHLSKIPLKSAQWHVPIMLAPDRTSVEWSREGEWDLPPLRPYLSAQKVFLIDGTAISYAESVMGIVEHYKLGEIVGEATAGTNGNVNPFPIPGGSTISWTGMKVLKHDGSRHHGVGIQPTVPVLRTIEGVAAGRDEYLEKALGILKRGG